MLKPKDFSIPQLAILHKEEFASDQIAAVKARLSELGYTVLSKDEELIFADDDALMARRVTVASMDDVEKLGKAKSHKLDTLVQNRAAA